MPHYSDGTEAKSGDLVKGKTYNLGGRTIVGTVLEVIPGTDSCNLRVAFADVAEGPNEAAGFVGALFSRCDGKQMFIRAGYDYGETKAFELLERAP